MGCSARSQGNQSLFLPLVLKPLPRPRPPHSQARRQTGVKIRFKVPVLRFPQKLVFVHNL